MLRSNLFFSKHAIGRQIKSPVDLVIGMLRSLDATTNMDLVAEGLLNNGQGLFYPPNVKGWEGGRAWINSSTLLGRTNLFAKLLADDATRFGGTTLVQYLERYGAEDAESALHHFETCLLAIPLDSETKQRLLVASMTDKADAETSIRSLLHRVLSLPQTQLG